MNSRIAIVLATVSVLAEWGYANWARAAGQPDPQPSGMPSGFSAAMASADIETLREVNAAERAKAKIESAQLIGALQLSCTATEAERVGRGRTQVQGKSVDVSVYEVACENGNGYLLMSQQSQKPLAISCFAAEATHVADAAQGKQSQMYCQLAANKDLKAMASTLMSGAGTHCGVSNVRWFGINAAAQTEFTEVTCEDGSGYLLKIAPTGPAPQVSVMSCQDAAGHGLQCHLTAAATPSAKVSMQALRDAITQHGVQCGAQQMHLIGRESVDRRYVVELQCAEAPHGLVVFVPIEGNTNPFESMDCKSALEERNVHCTLN
jgi:hypothetical protein